MSENEKTKKLTKNSKTHAKRLKNQPLLGNMIISSELNDIQTRATQVYNSNEIGFIPIEGGTKSSAITSSFKVNKCVRCKLEIEHHYGACYLYLPKLT